MDWTEDWVVSVTWVEEKNGLAKKHQDSQFELQAQPFIYQDPFLSSHFRDFSGIWVVQSLEYNTWR